MSTIMAGTGLVSGMSGPGSFTRFFGYLDQDLQEFIAGPGALGSVANALAPGHATETKQALTQVQKDLSA